MNLENFKLYPGKYLVWLWESKESKFLDFFIFIFYNFSLVLWKNLKTGDIFCCHLQHDTVHQFKTNLGEGQWASKRWRHIRVHIKLRQQQKGGTIETGSTESHSQCCRVNILIFSCLQIKVKTEVLCQRKECRQKGEECVNKRQII